MQLGDRLRLLFRQVLDGPTDAGAGQDPILDFKTAFQDRPQNALAMSVDLAQKVAPQEQGLIGAAAFANIGVVHEGLQVHRCAEFDEGAAGLLDQGGKAPEKTQRLFVPEKMFPQRGRGFLWVFLEDHQVRHEIDGPVRLRLIVQQKCDRIGFFLDEAAIKAAGFDQRQEQGFTLVEHMAVEAGGVGVGKTEVAAEIVEPG